MGVTAGRTGGAVRQLSAECWYWTKQHWYAGTLTVACSLFMATSWTENSAANDFTGRLEMMANRGGGIMVVSTVAECAETLESVGRLAQRLKETGVAVLGLVVADGSSESALKRVMDRANVRFTHESVRWREVAGFAAWTGTPVVVGVGDDGRVLFVEHVSSTLSQSADLSQLAARLGAQRRAE